MVVRKVDGVGLRRAIQRFGSLNQAIVELQCTKAILEEQVSQLNEEVGKQKSAREYLSSEIKDMNVILSEQKEQQRLLSEKIGNHSRQYELFQGFMAMLASSPSVNSSIEALIVSLKRLLEPGWQLSRSIEEMRILFIRTVLGDYLKCFYCNRCGSRFIVNKCQNRQYLLSSYQCPVCHYSSEVKADEFFIKALVSQEQLENTHLVEQLLAENAILKPLRAFLNVPCEMCGKPITDWAEENVKVANMGLGWGHRKCWNTTVGKAKLITKAFKSWQEMQTQNSSTL